MRGFAIAGGVSLIVMATFAVASTSRAQQADACAAAASLELPGYDLRIDSAEQVEGDGAAHCLVQGSFEHRTGADGKDYAIGFAVALPDEWSGRFLVQGGGGLNGVVRPPDGPTATGDQTALARGFAVISHDSGHQGEVWDSSFKADQLATLNFAGRSVEQVANMGKALVAGYYEREADRSYFAGCSTGGREGMVSAQRYPDLFDGIIIGAPAIRTNRSNMSLAAKTVAVNRISPSGDDGVPDRSAAFSDGDRDLIMEGVLEACDGLDGAEDGIIFNGAACSFDPAVLACSGDKEEGCLSAEQVEAVTEIFSPSFDASGREVYPSFPYDTGVMSTTDNQPGLVRFDDERNRQFRNHAMEFDMGAALEEVDIDDPHQRLINTDQWTDLSSFAHQGGKVLFFHGVSDPWFSSNDTVNYYERMLAATGERVDGENFSKLYLAPGVAHCRGGLAGLDQFDLLTSLVEWVEEGAEPESVVASGAAFEGRTRPLCPYPSYAHYTGDGDMEDAANFECRR